MIGRLLLYDQNFALFCMTPSNKHLSALKFVKQMSLLGTDRRPNCQCWDQ